MSKSFIISNVPADVSDVTLLRFVRENSHACNVKHIQPFPDAYHHINDKSCTKTLQIFFNEDEEGDLLKSLFKSDGAIKRLVHLEDGAIPANLAGHISVA